MDFDSSPKLKFEWPFFKWLLVHKEYNQKVANFIYRFVTSVVTYANTYTNACCSHPIADYPEEAEGVIGVKKAAVRRLNYELGIPKEQLSLDKLQYMTRILYKDEGDGIWGEHELDYVFCLQGDLKIKPNSNEICEISYVPRDELDEFVKTMRDPFTPWFLIILKHRLRLWWDNLDNLENFVDHEKIYKFKI